MKTCGLNRNDWLKCNKLSLNIGKSKYMIFHNLKKKVDNLHIKIENTYIERAKEFDFLWFNYK